MKNLKKHLLTFAFTTVMSLPALADSELYQVNPNLFLMDDIAYDLDGVIDVLQLSRQESIYEQLLNQVNSIKSKNELLSDLLETLVEANRALDAAMMARVGMYFEVGRIDEFLKSNDVDIYVDYYSVERGEWDEFIMSDMQYIETLKTTIDTLNSTSQMEMIRLQSIMDKHNQAFEEMTNSVSKLNKNKDEIISNIR